MGVSAAVLHGFTREDAECFGKPHFGAKYQGVSPTSLTNYTRVDLCCAICHREAISTHHQPRREHFTLSTPLGTWTLRPALIALCGTGTFGCHGKVEHNEMKIRWRWDTEEAAERWWSGELLTIMEPHSPKLYDHGCWVITFPDGHEEERRKRWHGGRYERTR